MDFEEIKEKTKKFWEGKCELDTENCYFLSKALNQEYWETKQDEEIEEEIEEEVEEDFGEFDDVEKKETTETKTKKPIVPSKENKPKVNF